MRLLAQHPHHVAGELLARLVGAISEAVEPHHAREQVGPRQRDLQRDVRAGRGELQLVNGERQAPPERPVDHRMAHLRGRYVEGAEFLLELGRVVDHRGEVAERDQLAVVEAPAHEAGVVVAALLAVGHDLGARPQLRGDAQPDRVVRRGLELRLLEPALEAVVHRPQHPARPRPAADAHHRQRRYRRRGSRPRKRVRDGDRDPELLAERAHRGRRDRWRLGCRGHRPRPL